jgi:alanine-alpha-ketoisovalerate/valine-pyruvate aminotransferase
MAGMEWAIAETLESPDEIMPSRTDPARVNEYYKWFTNTTRGNKFIRVVVCFHQGDQGDAFVLTAHLARRIPRRGE